MAFDDNRVKVVLTLPDHIRTVAIIPIGYSAETPRPTPRDHPRKVTFTGPYR